MNTKMVDITPENADQLIAMPEQEAMAIFSKMTTDQQVALISSAGNAQRAEQMLFLKPDSSDLIRELPSVVVAEIADYQLETTPDHILESVTPQQVLEIADSEWWSINNTVNQKQAERWLESVIAVDNPRKGEIYQTLQDYLVFLFMGKIGFQDRKSVV